MRWGECIILVTILNKKAHKFGSKSDSNIYKAIIIIIIMN